jgi:hypothetical protein
MTTTKFAVPRTVKAEHHELHHELTRAVEAGGRTGEAAMRLADLLRPHMMREEKLALPPLSLLGPLVRGEPIEETADVVAMSERLKAEFASLVQEHDAIVRALQELIVAAKGDRRPEIVCFAEKLVLHAEMEEEILYPAAILVGEVLKLRRTRLK